jgi:hypothetical protein
MDSRVRQQDMEDRQQIAEAINRASLAEQRAYLRTKILNAFLGTTVGLQCVVSRLIRSFLVLNLCLG